MTAQTQMPAESAQGTPPRKAGRRRRDERSMVPEPEFTSYYGRPVIKRPVWKSPDVPLYFFLGGLAGGSAVLGACAGATGRSGMARVSRAGAVTGATAGVAALIHDLGRPERFLNMLRVARPTSPLSMGSWLLASFSGFAAASVASDLTGVAPRTGQAAGAVAALLGAPLTTYTAVLVADTAVPAWHEGRAYLPFVFAGSSAASTAGLALLAAPVDEVAPVRRVAAAGAALSVAGEEVMGRRLGLVGEPYRQGRAGRWMKAARLLTAAGGVGAALSGNRRIAGRSGGRVVTLASGAALLAGSLCTRFGVFEAGIASAEDPKYTVVPQRERRARADAGGGVS